MAGFDQYQAIPGHNARFKDGNLNLKSDPNAALTESVVFLGTATDGPLMQPIAVTPENVYRLFGKVAHENGVYNGATLIPKFEEAWETGCRDIRLMRVTGVAAVSSLLGTSYSENRKEIAEDKLGDAQVRGNVEAVFTLPNGGITDGTFLLKAKGAIIPPQNYTLDAGTEEDMKAGTPATFAKVTLKENVADMESEITVSYEYTYKDAQGAVKSSEVLDNNTDKDGKPMIAKGVDVVLTLAHVARAGLKLYADGLEITDSKAFTVAGDKLTIHSNNKLKLGASLEAQYEYDEVKVIQPSIELEAIFGGGLYNDVSRKVDAKDGAVTITITKPESKRTMASEEPLVFKSTDYTTFELLVNAINNHPFNNVAKASTKNEYLGTYTSTLQASPETKFSGGKDELSLGKEEMYKRLGGEKGEDGFLTKQGAYQFLENYEVDYVIPLGVRANDKLVGKYDDFAYQLALACAVMSHYNSVTIGLIPTTSPSDTSLMTIEEHVKALEAYNNEFYMRDRFGNLIRDTEGELIDLGQFIEISAGPDFIVRNTRLGRIAATADASYIGMVSRLATQSAPTNKPVPVGGLRWTYSQSQLNRLTKCRMATFKIKPDGSVGVVDAPTSAHAGSDYTRLSTARIVKEAVNSVREVSDPFIGEPNDAGNRNALTAAVDKRLSKMIENKALAAFDFRLISTPQQELLGEASIELSLQAPNELRRLTTVVSLGM